MARIRTIKPEFWCSEQVAECSPTARLLFIGLWTFSDDGGVHPASLARIKMEVFPGDSITHEQVLDLIEELKNNSLLVEYEVHGKMFWQVTGWQHQKIDKPTYKHPRPDGVVPSTPRSAVADTSANDRRAISETSPPECNGEEEEKSKSKSKSTRGTRLPTDWGPSPEERKWAVERRPDLDIGDQVASFVDYWCGVAGAKGCKLDWNGAWRNWIRQAHAPRGRAVVPSASSSSPVLL